MKVIEVIPISRGITKETLSYFTAENVKAGDLVSVPLRAKSISALVVNTQDAIEAKSALKSGDFALRKAEKLQAESFLTPAYMESVYEVARAFATSTGSSLSALLPKLILEQASTLARAAVIEPTGVHESAILQASFEDRIGQYKSLIRENFARKQSVFICTPSLQDARNMQQSLSRGIETYTILLHPNISKKGLIEAWNKALTIEHPVLIIGTARFLCLPRADIKLLILEKENAKGYKTIGRPSLDLRTFAEIFARKQKIKLVYGDTLLRVETLWKHAQGECQEIISPSYRLPTQSTEEKIVDMRPYSASNGRSFKILSDELEGVISRNVAAGERLCIFTVRRGLAPITVCGDCGTIVECNHCKAPISLHSQTTDGEKSYFFLCHRCGERRSAEEKCRYCDSWKLVMLGIGIQGLEKELTEKFPEVPLFKIDADSTPTDKKVQEMVAKFMLTKGAILIGTEMMLSYLKPVEHVAIVSIDALFSLPDFRIHERLLYTLMNLRQLAEKSFCLQTRAPEERIFEYALKNNSIDFYREEIRERETYQYPPFSTLIKVSVHGAKQSVQTEIEEIKTELEPFELKLFPAFIKSADGHFVMHGLLKIPRKDWINEKLLAKLRSLPPQVTVSVDPESLL